MKNNETAVALCAVGAEKVVSNELRKMDLKVEDSLFGKVRFKADTGGLYRALIGLRAADRVLLEIAGFKANDFDALFEGTLSAPWEKLVPKGMGLKIVKVRVNRSQLKAETSIQSVVHKAAAQRLCGKYKVSRLPDNPPAGSAEVRVYIEKDIVSLLVDLSGEPLFKRGYRVEGGIAPLRETTAAAILLLSGWKRKFPLYDPFCGSGTILTEALMYAWDMAPGLGRHFSIENLLIADRKTEKSVRDELLAKVSADSGRLIRIAGSDSDARSASIAKSNVKRLCGIAEINSREIPVDIQTVEMSAIKTKTVEPGFLVTNPPYGKRLGDQAASEEIYRCMGRIFTKEFPGWKLAVITDHSGFESFFGKKADSCKEISNGAIPSFFYQYNML